MDTATKTTATERTAGELRKQNNALYRRRGEIEGALQREHVTQERAAAKRTLLIAELPGADDALTGYTHAEVDKLDEALRLSWRVAEGLEQSHAKLSQEIAALEPELREAELQVARERQAKLLTDFRNRLEQAAHQLAQSLDTSRRDFASLHLCAAKGIEEQGADEYRLAALRICEQVFAEFESKQTNLEARGLKRVATGFQNTSNTGVFVRPMIEG